VRQKPLEIALEQALAEPVGHSVGEPGGSAGLVGSQDPAHPLLAQVVGLIGFAQHRELAAAALAIGLELRRFVVHDVLMLDRDGGHVQSEQAPGLTRIVAGGADHVLGDDVALARGQMPFARRVRLMPVTSVCS
jgi:hypothetical protein